MSDHPYIIGVICVLVALAACLGALLADRISINQTKGRDMTFWDWADKHPVAFEAPIIALSVIAVVYAAAVSFGMLVRFIQR